MAGPLTGLRIIEFAGLGPGPFAGMMLSDMGAEVVRIDRPARGHETDVATSLHTVIERGRRSIAIDLKKPAGVEIALRLVGGAEAVFEGYRPGVAEKLGVGPDACLAINPAIVYGRMTGWGQTGPLAGAPGHDLNYIALAGALGAIGQAAGTPTIPLNLIGDFGGGGMLLAYGLLCGVLNARATGVGQVVDTAMVDGVVALMAPYLSQPAWKARGLNVIDGGSHFYNVYETADHRWVTIGSIEPQFYAALLDVLGLDPMSLPDQMDESKWPAMKEHFAAIFRTATADEWVERMEGREVCFAPVLDIDEVADDPHLVERGVLIDLHGIRQPMPAPRFDRTPADLPRPKPEVGEHTDELLAGLGITEAEVGRLRGNGVVA